MNTKNKIKIIGSITVAILFFSLYIPNITKASSGSSDSVPVSLEDDSNTIAIKDSLKNIETYMSTWNKKTQQLDKEAVKLARSVLYGMSDTIIKWVQTGFSTDANVRAAFISDPNKYFQDQASGISKSFINGQLSTACGPIASDVKRTLQIEQSNSGASDKKNAYDCTLDSSLNQNDSTTTNNGKMESFLGGDFNQGGWNMFSNLLEPQNNPNGLYLLAKDDLNSEISKNEADVNKQLDRGTGYMTKEVCTTLATVKFLDNSDEANSTRLKYGEDPRVTVSYDADYTNEYYQVCTPGTPGSMIANIVDKQLGVGTDQLVAVQDVNTGLNVGDASSTDSILNRTAMRFAQRVLQQGFLEAQVSTTTTVTQQAINASSTKNK